MENSLYVGLSRQLVLTRAMDMTANNIANSQTPGYRAQNPLFEEFISKPKYDSRDLSMVFDKGQYMTATAGPISATGGTYDFALNGPGFMAVTTPSGEVQYTRGGNFTVNSERQLVTASGYTVSGPGGGTINIPSDAREVVVTADGEVTADGNAVGRIDIQEFENLQDLKPVGNGLYSSATPGIPAVSTSLKQGYIEGSNVNAIQETSRMIEILRTYQSTMRMIQNEQERQVSAIQKLAKTNGG